MQVEKTSNISIQVQSAWCQKETVKKRVTECPHENQVIQLHWENNNTKYEAQTLAWQVVDYTYRGFRPLDYTDLQELRMHRFLWVQKERTADCSYLLDIIPVGENLCNDFCPSMFPSLPPPLSLHSSLPAFYSFFLSFSYSQLNTHGIHT